MSALTLRLHGKAIGAVLTNGHLLELRMLDGSECRIAWLDDNGVPIKGRPVLHQAGVRLDARQFSRDVINGPQLTRHGVAER